MKIKQYKRCLALFLPCAGLIFISCTGGDNSVGTDTGIPENKIKLSEAQIQLAGIEAGIIEEGSLGRTLSLTGVLKVNEETAVTISSRLSGRIEKLFFRNTGEVVNPGDTLYEIYSDDLVQIQREYANLQSNNWNFTGKYQPSLAIEDKLLARGLTPEQIRKLGKDGKIVFKIAILSQNKSKIRFIYISEGQSVEPGQKIFDLADDSALWLEAQVYPGETQYLKAGMPAEALINGGGEIPIKCNISFINPSFEKGKNVTLVRAVVPNKNGKLHPGMLALLNIKTLSSSGIVIPSSAVVHGKTNDHVWVMNGPGEFSSRIVRTGQTSGDSVVVLSGLSTAEMVVTSGVYLLNSEMILRYGTDVPAEQTDYITTMDHSGTSEPGIN